MKATTILEENSPKQPLKLQVARAGRILIGPGMALPISGWTSPTYGEKIPALACYLERYQALPLEFKSEWFFTGES